jgi:hypothetical protein
VTAGAPFDGPPTFVQVSVAAFVVALETELVNLARYSSALSLAVAITLYVADVAVAPGASLHELPPFVETCHCTVGVGVPEAAAVNVAVVAALVTWSLAGSLVIDGAVVDGAVPVTVSVTGFVVALGLTPLVNTARYSSPVSVAVVVTS